MQVEQMERTKISVLAKDDVPSSGTEDKQRPFKSDSSGISYDLIPGDAYAGSILAIRILYKISILLSYQWWCCLDNLIALFIKTTEEQTVQKNPSICGMWTSIARFCLKVLFYLITLILLLPLAILSFLIWFPLQLARPRPYSLYCAVDHRNERQHLLFTDITPYKQFSMQSDIANTSEKITRENKTTSFSKKTYTIVTGNVCLMPEFLARMNNVCNTVKRAEKISILLSGSQASTYKFQNCAAALVKSENLLDTEMLVKSNSEVSVSRREKESCTEDEVISFDSESSFQWSVSSKERAVCETFPKWCDFLCLQEIFDRRAADVLLKGLRAKYPYILYDVIWPLHHSRISLLNSGLCIASKYPFINVEFKAFPDGFREDKLACKGLLMTKVYLGDTENGKPLVGYLATTHLQALTHTKASEVRCKQLNLLQSWLEEFRESCHNENHITVFDIICGDFNFDQESHFEEEERSCRFRQIYRDPCINETTGQQHSWVIGTELKADLIHDHAVNSAKGLQRMLISELERPRYVASTLPANCAMTSMSNGQRRIDYVLYRPCGDKKMVIRDYKFVTGFATLTDHIPISMSFAVDD